MAESPDQRSIDVDDMGSESDILLVGRGERPGVLEMFESREQKLSAVLDAAVNVACQEFALAVNLYADASEDPQVLAEGVEVCFRHEAEPG